MLVKAQMTARGIDVLERAKLTAWKAGITPGSFIALTVEPWDERRGLDANALWHALVQRYARATGYGFEYARAELKYLYGIKMQYSAKNVSSARNVIPPYSGRFVELYDEIWFLKSTAEYKKREFTTLIDGTIAACHEVGADIADILEGLHEAKS
jgi:hypothetical protein